MALPLTVEPGDVVRLSRFEHVDPDGSRFTFSSTRRDRTRVYVLLFLGAEDKKGERPLDGEQVLNAMGWIKDPEKWESDEDEVGSKQLTAEELLTPLKQAEERYEALRSSVRSLAEQMDGSGVKFDLLELTAPQEARS